MTEDITELRKRQRETLNKYLADQPKNQRKTAEWFFWAGVLNQMPQPDPVTLMQLMCGRADEIGVEVKENAN